MMLVDAYERPIGDLRISVTDRCNFRCTYCMPLDEYEWINKKEILTFEEITRLAILFVRLGVEKIRLTGGEPLVRQNLDRLVGKALCHRRAQRSLLNDERGTSWPRRFKRSDKLGCSESM